MNDRGNADQESATSLTLLSLLKAGDGDAWHNLVRDYGMLVEDWTVRSGVPKQDVADVVQDVLQSVAGSIDRFHRDQAGDSFRKWLRVITTNKIRDYFRRKQDMPVAHGGTTAMQRIHHAADKVADESFAEVDASEFVLSAVILFQRKWRRRFGDGSSLKHGKRSGAPSSRIVHRRM